MLVGYASGSTEEQSLNRQIDMSINYGVDNESLYIKAKSKKLIIL